MGLSIRKSNINGLRLVKDGGGPIILPGGLGYTVNELLKAQGIDADVVRAGSEFIAPIHAAPTLVRGHEAFLRAGTDVLFTDTFCAGVGRQSGDAHLVDRFIHAGKAAANIAISKSGRLPVVGLSLTTSGDTHDPRSTPDNTILDADHRQNISLLVPPNNRVGNFIQAETLPTGREGEIVSRICAERGIAHNVCFVADDDGNILDGTEIEQAALAIAENNPYFLGIGVNCCSIEGAEKVVARLHALFNERAYLFDGKHIIAYPNAFLKSEAENADLQASCCGDDHHDQAEHVPETLSPEQGAEVALSLRDNGATMIGLCCGADPKNTKAYAEALTGQFTNRAEMPTYTPQGGYDLEDWPFDDVLPQGDIGSWADNEFGHRL